MAPNTNVGKGRVNCALHRGEEKPHTNLAESRFYVQSLDIGQLCRNGSNPDSTLGMAYREEIYIHDMEGFGA